MVVTAKDSRSVSNFPWPARVRDPSSINPFCQKDHRRFHYLLGEVKLRAVLELLLVENDQKLGYRAEIVTLAKHLAVQIVYSGFCPGQFSFVVKFIV